MSADGRRKEFVFISVLYGVSVVIAAWTMAPLGLHYAKWRIVWLAFIIGSLALFGAAWIAYRRGKHVKWLISIAMLNVVLVVPEFALRNAHFRYASGIQFGYPKPKDFLWYRPHERLFWTLRPSDEGVNQLGFPGDEIRMPKPPDIYRIVFFGDSCTQQGYPDDVERMLRARNVFQGKAVECVTLAIAGYSSHQGRVLAELYGEALQPDRAFVFYGWNDHWPAYGATDADKQVTAPTDWTSRLIYVIEHVRLYQLGRSIVDRFRVEQEANPIDQVRVPITAYKANLSTLTDGFRTARIPVVLMTAPTSHVRLGVSDELLETTRSKSAAWLMDVHRQYNEVVRDLARENHLLLLDLEREMEALSDRELQGLFMRDGIHFTPAGRRYVAARIVRFMMDGEER